MKKTVTAILLITLIIACATTEFDMQGVDIVIIFDESKSMHKLNLTKRFNSTEVDLVVYNKMLLNMILNTFPVGLKEFETRDAGFCTEGFWIQWNFNNNNKKGVCETWNENFPDNLDQTFINMENKIYRNRVRSNNMKDVIVVFTDGRLTQKETKFPSKATHIQQIRENNCLFIFHLLPPTELTADEINTMVNITQNPNNVIYFNETDVNDTNDKFLDQICDYKCAWSSSEDKSEGNFTRWSTVNGCINETVILRLMCNGSRCDFDYTSSLWPYINNTFPSWISTTRCSKNTTNSEGPSKSFTTSSTVAKILTATVEESTTAEATTITTTTTETLTFATTSTVTAEESATAETPTIATISIATMKKSTTAEIPTVATTSIVTMERSTIAEDTTVTTTTRETPMVATTSTVTMKKSAPAETSTIATITIATVEKSITAETPTVATTSIMTMEGSTTTEATTVTTTTTETPTVATTSIATTTTEEITTAETTTETTTTPLVTTAEESTRTETPKVTTIKPSITTTSIEKTSTTHRIPVTTSTSPVTPTLTTKMSMTTETPTKSVPTRTTTSITPAPEPATTKSTCNVKLHFALLIVSLITAFVIF